MRIKNELAKFVDKEYVSDSMEDRVKYSRDFSLLSPGVPDAVVWRQTQRRSARLSSGVMRKRCQ